MQVNITDRQDEILDRVNNLISAHRDDEYSTKFNNDEIRDGFSSLVLYQKSYFELEQNWSVAELRIGNDIYEALRNWFLSENLYQYFNSIINKTDPNPSILLRELEDFWLLFFIFECEHLRRSAINNDEVWQTLFEALRYSVFKSLFNKEGHATEKHRKIIKDVVIKNRMRNTFTDSNSQAWFNTFYLQIGFPRGGIKNLRLWVSRHNLTRSQELLLDTKSEEFSSNFHQLYSHLENIRYDTYDQSSLEFLEACPWILKDWLKDIFGILSRNKTCTHFDHEINCKTKIIWDGNYGSKPSVCLDLSYNSSSVSLDNPRIFFKCHKEEGWLNKTDRYKRKVSFPFADLPSVLVISLYSENGEMILEKDISIWNEEDDISLFDDKGNKISNLFKSNPRLQYAIIASDLRVEPSDTPREKGLEFDLIKIDSQYDYNIYLDDILAWSSNEISLERVHTASKNLNRVYLKPDYSKSGKNHYNLFVDHAPNINISNAVIFNHIYYTDKIKRDDRSEFSSITTSELGHEKVKISYNFENNKFIHRETVVIPQKGVLINRRDDRGWQRLNHNDHLTLSDLEKLPFKIIPPENQNSELFFMQGNRILHKYPDKVLKGIRKCFGYGSRLILRENPINAVRESFDVPISLCIVDTGIIRGIKNRGNSIHLVINTPPLEDHKIFCILNDATVQCFKPELISDSSDKGNWLVCVKYADLSCVLVTFKDKVSGSFWIKENYLKPLEATAQHNNQNIQNILTYYRNLKAPILFSTKETNSSHTFMGIMKNNFVQVISGLLSLDKTFKLNESILKASTQINEDQGWLYAIREKLWFFNFDMLEEIDRIYMALKEILTSISSPKQLETFICLFEVAPFLATFFFKKELLKNKNETEKIASFIHSYFEGKLNEINEAEFDNDLSRTLSLDEGFIEDTIQKVYKINKNYLNQDKILNHSLCREDEMLEHNLKYLLEFDSFRYKLIVKLLT